MKPAAASHLLVVLAAIGVAASPRADALVYQVTGFDDPSPPPLCVATDCPSLRAAVIAANLNPGADEIALPAGAYTLAIAGAGEDAAMTGDLDVLEDLAITGAGATTTTIDGADLDRVFHVLDANTADTLGSNLTLGAVTVRNGSVLNENGGGVLVSGTEGGAPPLAKVETGGTSLTLIESVVSGNAAAHDMLDPQGKPVGGSGGGIASEGALTVSDAVFEANTSTANGGGIYVASAWSMTRSTVRGNTAEGGGGIFDTGSHVSTISASTISGNTATGGGGINVRTNVAMVITNCTIDGNSAIDVGAGIQSNAVVNLVNSTVTGNGSGSDAPTGGGGLNSFASGSFRFWNTIVAGNVIAANETPVVRNCGCTGTACTPGVQFVSSTSLEDGDSCGFNPQAGDFIDTDPMLLPLRNYGGPTETRALIVGSPAIDTGSDTGGANGCPATDQRGVARPIDATGAPPPPRCDIGAVEFDPANDLDLDLVFRHGFED